MIRPEWRALALYSLVVAHVTSAAPLWGEEASQILPIFHAFGVVVTNKAGSGMRISTPPFTSNRY
jgi:hypothetical protein